PRGAAVTAVESSRNKMRIRASLRSPQRTVDGSGLRSGHAGSDGVTGQQKSVPVKPVFAAPSATDSTRGIGPAGSRSPCGLTPHSSLFGEVQSRAEPLEASARRAATTGRGGRAPAQATPARATIAHGNAALIGGAVYPGTSPHQRYDFFDAVTFEPIRSHQVERSLCPEPRPSL